MSAPIERETRAKLGVMRAWLAEAGAGAVRLRGVDWFAWATAGACGAPRLSAECGAAEVLVTPRAAYLLCDQDEADRLRCAPLGADWTWQVAPWMQRPLREHFVANAADGGPVLSDRPHLQERLLPALAHAARLVLTASERERYRGVGRLAAAAAGEALRAARPGWTEYELAGAAAHALWARGLQPAMVLAASAERARRWHQPAPSVQPLGQGAMLAVCARRHGLHANLIRCVQFSAGAAERDAAILALEAVALDACEVDQPLCQVFLALDGAYAYAGQPDALSRHPQGGITGYQAREVLATRHSETRLRDGMALAFQPALHGGQVEDTFLLENGELDNLTCDPAWPSAMVQGRRRPLTLERT
ncbi:MAG: M24 family metallopeptidase [Pseudomonadota bacterium]